MQKISLWRKVMGSIIFIFGIIILLMSVKDVLTGRVGLFSIDIISGLLFYIFALLTSVAFIYPAKEHKKA
ncbi:MAG: hypothetical protein ABIH39_03230 [Candidatus Margulisiibacteriota bacterium]